MSVFIMPRTCYMLLFLRTHGLQYVAEEIRVEMEGFLNPNFFLTSTVQRSTATLT